MTDLTQQRRRSQWLIGFTLYLVFNVLGTVVQLASLPLIVLAPLGAISLIPNVVFARLLLKDKRRELLQGIALIVVGATLIAYHSDLSPEHHLSFHRLMKLFGRTSNKVYLTLQALVIGGALVAAHFWDQRRAHSVAEEAPLIGGDRNAKRNGPAVLFASCSGVLSGLCLLLAKGGIDVLSRTIIHNGKWWMLLRWQIWLLVTVLVAAAIMQLYYLNLALKSSDPSLISPLAFCFYNVSSILNGLVFFNQYTHTSKADLVTISAGTITLLIGVWIISLNENVEQQQPVQSTNSSPNINAQHSPPISPILQQGFSIGISANSPGFTYQEQSRQSSLIGSVVKMFKGK